MMGTTELRRVAIIGSGISGLGAGWLASRAANVTVFEADSRLGGHARTVEVEGPRGPQPVDTGFIVFNHRTYPNLIALFDRLGVATEPSNMSFAVSVNDGAIEFGCETLNAWLGQRRNVVNPLFWLMIRDILRFNARALGEASANPDLTLGALIDNLRLGRWFEEHYLLPMGGAIWSTPRAEIRDFPALAFTRFLDNHGLMTNGGQPKWWTVTGGSREYVAKLAADMNAEIRLNAPVTAVRRDSEGVWITAKGAKPERFDIAFLAAHSDQTLAILADADPQEADILGRIRYKENRMVLHRDASFMPKRRACWSSWVYQSHKESEESAVSVTYWMNRLQNIPEDNPLFITLNPRRPIRPDLVLDEATFHHPQYDFPAIRAQQELAKIQGRGGVYYCGAWAGNGFHEDGLASAVAAARLAGFDIPW